ncbi:amidohydrolase family protein [Cognatishimia sp. SS12]|uniref:amidohydrolase family protein n=1 Tax=Cognatishimia sp. SS12 TaxID=2979465 RepID=UPI002330D0F7|nr:amidohydrolase family protein [Cognatishimia sp. SS12]MDC0738649.1 amidohydrolase family protein [Cognatishimia sp. SS12]
MRIDAHHHLWDLDAVSYPWLMEKGAPRFFGDPTPIQRNYLLPEFSADARQHGMRGSVHIQVGAADPLAEARWVDAVAAANPDWPMVQVAACDLTDDALLDRLAALSALPSLRGVRQIIGRAPGEDAKTGTNDLLTNPAFAKGLAQLGARGLSFDLQLLPELMEATADILKDTPQTPVVLCHAGSPHDRTPDGLKAWARALRLLSDLPHVSCKLSGLGMFDHDWTAAKIAPIVSEVLAQFGAQRVMFGSNFPVDSLSSDYSTLIAAYEALVPATDHAAVFGGTAQRFYRF